MHYYSYGPYGYDMMGGYEPFGFIFHIIGILFCIFLAIWVIRLVFGRGRMHRRMLWHTSSALDILSDRFAKGEIDKAEYEERKKTLLEVK